MTDLVEFLRARLRDDEEAAKAATSESGRWTWEHGLGELCNDPECPYGSLLDQAAEGETHLGTVLMDVHGYDVRVPWQGAEHIARHDPARVLREVEAKRRIVDEHEVTDAGCGTCGNYDPTGLHEYRTDGPCPTLRLLALPYADHPEFRKDWRLEV